MRKVVHAACPHDCPDACGVLITVDDGRAVKIQGDPAHPVTRGFLCAKVAKYLDRVYSPSRVMFPLRRKSGVAKRPCASSGVDGWFDPNVWERVSWNQALDTICDRFRSISRDFGPEAILPYSYGGTLGALGNASMDRRFFHRLGASQLDRTICATAGGEALVTVVGRKLGTEPEQTRHSRLIIAWGANIHGNAVHLWPFIEEARRAGGKLVVIDPYKTRTARAADWYLPINPGTDVALALGIMHVIIGEDLYDHEYVERHTLGFPDLRKKVRDYTPDRVAQWTGIAAGDIVKLAREYATVRPASIRVNYGVQRTDNGGMAMRAITMLPCITGSWKEIGGGLTLSLSGGAGFNQDALDRADLMQKSPAGRVTRIINMSSLASALNELNNPPVKALFVYNSNPAAIAPDHNNVIRGLQRQDLFTVVHEQFMTDTTDYADIVLPATTFFEHKDLQKAYGHYFVMMSEPAIAPLGESRSNVETFRALAQRMGFTEDCFVDSADDMIDQALTGAPDDRAAWLAGITREALEREHHMRLKLPTTPDTAFFLPFANGFPTPSGKAELYSESLKAMGLDPVAEFKPPAESRNAPLRKYPLELLSRKADNFLNSTFCNIESVQQMEQADLLEMTEADAKARGIADGDPVRVFNDRGEVRLKAHVNGSVQKGVVAARLAWAKQSESKRSINALTSERLTDIGRGPTFYACLVEVAKV